MTTYWCEHAWLPPGLAHRVRVGVEAGRFSSVVTGADPQPGDERLAGVVLPGLADNHSHAFHRALRGRTQHDGGSFWSWRTAMYRLAERLDPESYLALARAGYAELALGGVTAVAEFHYLHHGPGGVPYAEPNVMAVALGEAAADAGVRLTLLDTCYLAGGLDRHGYVGLEGVQQRFGDRGEDGWADRVALLAADPPPGVTVGVAAHSVRAVPPSALRRVAELAEELGSPRHAHLSEQPAENTACRAVHGRTPTALLADTGFLGPRATAVHATHLSAPDVDLLGGAGAIACFCPTTEQDLADGIGPARALRDAGCRLALGSDQHAVADLLAEARLLEMGERLETLRRGRFSPAELMAALTNHAALGGAGGEIAVGAPADLVAVSLRTPRTAGIDPAQVVPVAGADDVHTVVAGGRVVVRDGRHALGDVGAMLARAIEPLWEGA